eukprot:1182378-Prorocentrum_minimum.AAC.1
MRRQTPQKCTPRKAASHPLRVYSLSPHVTGPPPAGIFSLPSRDWYSHQIFQRHIPETHQLRSLASPASMLATLAHLTT